MREPLTTIRFCALERANTWLRIELTLHESGSVEVRQVRRAGECYSSRQPTLEAAQAHAALLRMDLRAQGWLDTRPKVQFVALTESALTMRETYTRALDLLEQQLVRSGPTDIAFIGVGERQRSDGLFVAIDRRRKTRQAPSWYYAPLVASVPGQPLHRYHRWFADGDHDPLRVMAAIHDQLAVVPDDRKQPRADAAVLQASL